MIRFVSTALIVLLSGHVASAAPVAEAAPTAPRAAVATVSERGGWGLIVGLAILGLALRGRRRTGPVVTD